MPSERKTKVSKKPSDKKRRTNLALHPIRPELRDTFYEFIFKDISDEVFDKLKYYNRTENSLYKIDIDNPENTIKIVDVSEDQLMAHKNYIMGFMTKILPIQPTIKINIKNKEAIENTIEIPILPPSMYKILRYDGTCLLNTKYVMKKKDKIFQKKDLTPIDKQIFKYWDDVIANSQDENFNLQECIEKLAEFVNDWEESSDSDETTVVPESTTVVPREESTDM